MVAVQVILLLVGFLFLLFGLGNVFVAGARLHLNTFRARKLPVWEGLWVGVLSGAAGYVLLIVAKLLEVE